MITGDVQHAAVPCHFVPAALRNGGNAVQQPTPAPALNHVMTTYQATAPSQATQAGYVAPGCWAGPPLIHTGPCRQSGPVDGDRASPVE